MTSDVMDSEASTQRFAGLEPAFLAGQPAGHQLPLALTELAAQVATELSRHYADLQRVQADIAHRRQVCPDPGTALVAGIEVISDVTAVRERIDELSFFARRTILALQPMPRSGETARQAAQRPDSRSVRRGLDIRVVVDRGHGGEHGPLTVRLSAMPLPCRLIILDSEVAITGIEDPDHPGAAMVIREPTLVRALSCLFDSVWNSCPAVGPVDQPTPDEQKLLELLLAGGTDESIARSLGVCDRQVRRRTARLLERLGALNRFSAGAAAVQRGWL